VRAASSRPCEKVVCDVLAEHEFSNVDHVVD
jgi:hypothetical protein